MVSHFTRFVVKAQRVPLEAETSPVPTELEPSSVLIRLKAIAVNPGDVKMIDDGHRGASYPLVAGLDGAGIIEAIGEGVTGFSIGDSVTALFSPGGPGGSYQEMAVVTTSSVAKIPSIWSFEEAATLSYV